MRHSQAQPDKRAIRVQRPGYGFDCLKTLVGFFSRKPKTSVISLMTVFVLLTLVLSLINPWQNKQAHYAQAATQSTIGFQARLYNANGSVVPDGYYNIEFKLYNQSSGGSSLWTETYYDSNGASPGNDNRLRVVNGYLSAPLGSLTAFSGIDWDQEHWVTLNVGGSNQTATPTYDGEMTPRLKLTAVPYALRAGQLAKANGLNTSVLDFISPTADRTMYLPDASGTVLLDSTGFANGGNSFGGLATLGTNDGNDLGLETNGSEKVRIESGGDVGIGTTNPLEKLDVNGAIRLGNTTNSNAGTMRWNGTDFEGYNGTEWKSLTDTGGLVVNPTANKIKSADEIVNNSNVFQNDDELFFNVGANESWTFRFVVHGSSATTPDFKFSITAPTGATCTFGVQDAEGAVTNANLGCGASTGAIAGNGAAVNDVYEVLGSVTNGSTAGAVRLQWAQNTANASNTTIRAGSTLNAVRVSGMGQTAEAFIQDGNSFSSDATIGTNDNYALKIETNGVERASFNSSGLLTLLQGASIGNGLNLTSGDYQLNGTSIITSGGVLQNVTANTSILTSGTLGNNRGGTGLDTSGATNGQLLIGNGSGFSLGTLANNGGLTITNSAGGIGLAVNYGSSANTAVQGNTQITCASGSGNLSGGGTVITLGSGGTCGAITTNNAVSFSTSVTTPLITNAGGLTVQTTGANDLTINSGSGLIALGATQFSTTAGLTFDMASSSATTLTLNNSGSGIAGLSVEGGGSFGGLVTGTSGLTVSGGIVSINHNSNFATNINTGTSTGTVTIGGGNNAFSIDSTAFDVSSGGLVSGVAGYNQSSGNFSMSGTGTFGTGSGSVSLNGATTVSTSTNSATALTVNGTSGTAATALNIVQTGNAANLTLSNTARTTGALIGMTHSTSAFTGTGLQFNFASGSGSFASGNFADFQLNGTSRFRVDNTGGLQITSDSANGLNIRSTGGVDYFDVDVAGNTVRIGSATADAIGVLFVLDTKNTTGDPTGVNGGSYYNSADNKGRCYENGAWTDCITKAVVGETTLSSANGTISINLDYAVESLQCRVEIKGRSAAAVPYLRFNNNSTGNAYSWNQYGITGATVIDSQDNSDAEIQLSGTATSTQPFSSNLNITNFSDTRKGVDWTAVGLDAIGTNANRFSGVGVFDLTSGSISSVQIIASTGTFAAGSHLWCEGRNVR